MLEWLLTGHDLLGATVTSVFSSFLVGYVLSTICAGETKTRKRLEILFFVLPFVVSVALVSIMLYIKSNTTEEYTHTSEWKVIYTNDIDAKIELHFEVDKLLGLKKQITAGTELTNAHRILQTTRNGIVNGRLSSTSKITKVEYRPVTGKRNTAFGKYGDETEPDVDGEVRITIESNEDENAKQLKALFGE